MATSIINNYLNSGKTLADFWKDEGQKGSGMYGDLGPAIAAGVIYDVVLNDSNRQKVIDEIYNGNESLFVRDVNALNEDSYFIESMGSDFNKKNVDDWTKGYGDYYTGYSERAQSESVADVFGADFAGVTDDMSYEEKTAARSNVLKAMLGDEIYNIGEDIDPVKLIDFAEWAPTTDQELVQDATKVTPLKDRQQELKDIATGKTKQDSGKEARDLIAKASQKGIPGLKTALAGSEGASNMESSFSRMSDRASAQSAMAARISQFEDKQDATSNLSAMTDKFLSYDTARKNKLKSARAKAAVGLAGAQLTAKEHAAQLAKSSAI